MKPTNSHKKVKYKSVIYLLFYLSLFIGITACSENEPVDDSKVTEEVYGTEFSQFQFLKSNNPSLAADINLSFENNHVWINLPLNTDMENLVATFSTNSKTVLVNGTEQTSDQTGNDFSKEIIYTLNGSENQTEEYSFNLEKFTGLPIIYLNTNGQAIDSKEGYRTGTVLVDGNYDYANLNSTAMEIKGRGNSTWYTHPKKPYQMKFDDKTEFLGMPKDKKWLFLAEYSDKTLLRNKIAFEMGYLSNLDWTPQSEFAEVFINEEYAGTYNITQKLESSENRVNLGDDGYLLEIDQMDRLDPEDVYFETNDFLINIKEPEIETNSEAHVYIKELIIAFETALHASNFKDPIEGYAKFIDINSFVDWYLISEIVKNQDSKDFSSIYLNVIPGEKIKMGPLWDFDLAFGNVDYSDARYPEGFWVKDHTWYARLFEDPKFLTQVKARFAYFRSKETLILDKIDAYTKQLHWAQEKNDNKWNLFGNYVWPNPVYFNTHQEEVNHLKTWYTKRMNWLDTALNSL
ncbi:CotH kinase family protein [Tamlana sp. I1]|uniref:CotH kinase family protein n=1 Tax=Tamlana sp. I1 TaxID=2762061 RepID=UPI00188F20B4|nr:CotH kinase family protein [Tamlana sp. I1]